MFGSRCPLLSPEDGGGSGGASGAAEGGAGPAPANAADGGNAGGKSFTQAEVDQIVKDRLAKATRATQQPAPKPTATDAGGEEKLTMRELKAQLDEERSRREFDRRASKLGLADEVADDLFTLSQVQKPADVGEWLTQKSKLFGSGATNGSAAAGTSNASAAAPPQQQEQPAKPPAAAPSAPGKHDGFVDSGGMIDIYHLKPEQRAAIKPMQLREIHERNVRMGSSSSGAPPLPRIGVQQKR